MEPGKTIQQIKEGAPPDLWHFLGQLPASFEAQQLYALILAGTLGMFANYLVKWARGEIAGSLFDYLFDQQLRLTILSFCSFVGLGVTSIGAGIFTTDTGAFVGWATVLWFGVTNGFTVDAIVNKGRRAEWSEAERNAKTPPPAP